MIGITIIHELLTSSLADTISAACVSEATTSILSNNAANLIVFRRATNNNFNSG